MKGGAGDRLVDDPLGVGRLRSPGCGSGSRRSPVRRLTARWRGRRSRGSRTVWATPSMPVSTYSSHRAVRDANPPDVIDAIEAGTPPRCEESGAERNRRCVAGAEGGAGCCTQNAGWPWRRHSLAAHHPSHDRSRRRCEPRAALWRRHPFVTKIPGLRRGRVGAHWVLSGRRAIAFLVRILEDGARPGLRSPSAIALAASGRPVRSGRRPRTAPHAPRSAGPPSRALLAAVWCRDHALCSAEAWRPSTLGSHAESSSAAGTHARSNRQERRPLGGLRTGDRPFWPS